MAHGYFVQAFRFHPVGPILFGLVVFQIPYRLWALVKFPNKMPLLLRMINKLTAGLTIIAIFAFWLIKLYAEVLSG